MSPALSLPLLTFTALGLSACSTTLARIDQQNLRGAMMRYTEDQIMDNLIRTYECLPVVHFDIKTMDAVVGTELGTALSGGETITNVATGFANVVRPLAWAVSPKRSNTITVTVEPVENANEVYAAYTYFALNKKVQGLIRVPHGEKIPDKENVLIGRVGGPRGDYYYVPVDKKEDFRKLCLRVAVTRGSITGAPTPLEFEPAAPGKERIPARSKLTPLDAPAVTSPLDRDNSGLNNLEGELRKLRLLR